MVPRGASGAGSDKSRRSDASGDRRGRGFAQAVQSRPFDLPLFGRHAAERLEQPGNAALLAEQRHAQSLDRVEAVGCSDFALHLFGVHHKTSIVTPAKAGAHVVAMDLAERVGRPLPRGSRLSPG